MPVTFSQFRYFLAPIEDNTDNALRTLCYRHGADYTFTEMIHVEGLVKRNRETWSKLVFQDDTPTIIQLLAGNEQQIAEALKMFEPPKSFSGFNLNLGCPSPDAIKLGLGCAFIKRVAKTQKLIDVFREYSYPVSVKMRVGMNAYEKQKKVYLNLINGTDPDYFIVHARHGGQGYIEPSDFSVYPECVNTGKVIVANGDIKSKENIDFLKSIGVQGAMLGRAGVCNPSIFDVLKGNPAVSIDALRKEYVELSEKYDCRPKYRANVLKRLGQAIDIDAQRLV